MPLCIFFAIAFFWFIKFISVVFPHACGDIFVCCKACWMGFCNKNSLMSLQLEADFGTVSKGIEGVS